eukprot:6141869-Alexandrium_andersonii.AAC.1
MLCCEAARRLPLAASLALCRGALAGRLLGFRAFAGAQPLASGRLLHRQALAYLVAAGLAVGSFASADK